MTTREELPMTPVSAAAFTINLWLAAASSGPPRRNDDELDAMRGIVSGVLLSILAFWLPLAIALAR
jgi:hypothetical protein